MRTERCVCGGSITAPDLSVSAPYVEAHGRSFQHKDWRLRCEATPLGLDTYRYPLSGQSTACVSVVDLSDEPGASAARTGGAV